MKNPFSFLGKQRTRKRSLSARLFLQPLEDRYVPSTITVTNTHNGNIGSLRQAILTSNANPGVGAPNVINFNLPSGGGKLITLFEALPAITSPVVINGPTNGTVEIYSYTGTSLQSGLTIDAPGCTISGLEIGGWGWQIQINSSNNVIEGNIIGDDYGGGGGGILIDKGDNNTIGGTTKADANVITQNAGDGIAIDNGQENQIEGNFIGCTPNNRGVYNSLNGVEIEGADSQYNTIGGTATGAANVISGNGANGVAIDAGATDNTVAGNFIGTDLGGEAVGTLMGNYGDGIYIGGGANGNFIGTTIETNYGPVGVGNVISGNGTYGVAIAGAGTDSNTLAYNEIGTDTTGTKALPNGLAGVLIHGAASNNLVGMSEPVAANVISGNSAQGVVISGKGTTDNVVTENYIGTNSGGTAALKNGSYGVMIEAGAAGNLIGTTGSGNVISGNTKNAGVYIANAGTSGNSVEGNLIGVNAADTAKLGNLLGVEIALDASNNFIGGAFAGDGNVISGNVSQGVLITNAGTKGNVIEGNTIGTDRTGVLLLSNAYSGVTIDAGAAGNTVGGAEAADGNTISGNGGYGVYITGAGSDKNTVAENIIGTDSAGIGALSNSLAGVAISAGASDNAVGDDNLISGNIQEGVLITGTGTKGNVVEGNLIGTNEAGSAALGNGFSGVAIDYGATGNTVGGTDEGDGNTLSGNGGDGVDINTAGTENNMVQGNLIGTNSLGTAAVGNLSYGVVIGGGASNNTIDGVNTISGNALDGILMASPGTIHNEVNDNVIGLNAAGNGALPNGMSGVTIGSGASANGVDNNFISGNSGDGIHLSGAGTEGNEIRTNLIGLEFDETTALPNTSGIFIDSGASDNVIGGSSKGNTIADNADAGIAITGKTSIGNTISQNSIFGNDGLGIDLGNTGTPTANTPVGAQAGPNDLLNHPVLTAGTANGTVDVSFNSTPNTPFKIELFASSTGTPGQGQIYLGSVNVVTAASGEADFTYFFNPTATDPYLTATATEGGTHKNTSEFSAPLELSEST